jgi:hypothetical protein
MTALTDIRTQPLNEMELTEVFHVEHRSASETGEVLELARYSVTDCGQRILSWQRVDGMSASLTVRPPAAARIS